MSVKSIPDVGDNMAESKDKLQLDDSSLFKTIASGSSSEIEQFLRLCNSKTTHFSNHALNWAVLQACNIGHAHLLQFLLQDGTRLELRDDNGNTPLMICSKRGFPGIVGTLIGMFADVNAKNNNGDTALMLATSMEVINCLLEDRLLNLDEQNSIGNTALMSAIETSHLQKVKLLINAGANPKKEISKTCQTGLLVNSSGESAFDMAKRKGFGQLFDLLYRAKLANSNPLQLAAVENDFESSIALLKYKLCDKDETQNIQPDILCHVLRQIKLREAILTSDVELILELCRLGMDVNMCQCCKKSRMELVLNIGSYELAEILCAHDARVTHDDLVSAVIGKHIQMIPLLVSHGAPVNKYNDRSLVTYKESALDIALQSSLTNTASVLLCHGAELDADCAVAQAFKSKNTKTLSFLLTECAETTKAVMRKPETLIRAVKLGDIQLIQILLEAGADIDGVHNNMTPLMSAFDIDVIKFLLNKGANVNFKTTTTALIYALSWDYFADITLTTGDPNLTPIEIEEKMLPVIDLFLKHGANLEDSDDCGCTALMDSAKGYFSTEILKYLIHKGTDINRKDDEGLTALHSAATNHKLDFAEAFLKCGAIVNLKSFYGRTPLHQAVKNVNIIKLFLENQAKVNAKDKNGDTPLSLAVKYPSDMFEVVKLLIASGSDVNHRNSSAMSPLWLAAQNFNIKCMKLLIEAKADLSHDDQLQKSALSILLNDWLPYEQSQQTASILVQHGASAKFVRSDVIHRLIAAGNDGILIQKLIKSRFCPTDIILKSPILNWPETCVSPLAVSLILDSVDFSRYFIENWYLTKSDIKILSRKTNIMNCLQKRRIKALLYLKQVSRQPMRLELLCFITVSSALGSDLGRRERVHNSKLPFPFQDLLLFSKLEVKVLQQVTRDGTGFLHELSNNQVDGNNEDKCSLNFMAYNWHFL
ncbi:ankyrin repeat and KH domain-containing protein 1 [Biomphalaria pfeifferi]|uniref:Ankyrin repeat and KH domain-containing protein 1 n=1 Tax=Biomphalaria pfeifferi TaxID=112525 RepID=A0AAD8F1I8_BIOPF|nr:ankyrin repeat and KH domain-containing protein 1 [Biomphalaria pfeifferi]